MRTGPIGKLALFALMSDYYLTATGTGVLTHTVLTRRYIKWMVRLARKHGYRARIDRHDQFHSNAPEPLVRRWEHACFAWLVREESSRPPLLEGA